MIGTALFRQDKARTLQSGQRLNIGLPLAILAIVFTAAGAALGSDSSLIEMARYQDAAAVRILLDDGADPHARQADGATALHWAVFRENIEMAASLIEAGADINAVNRLGASALFIAAKGGHAGLIEHLLKAGADPNIALPMGETPVMTAARSGSAEGVRHLIDAGAEVNLSERSRGQTALMWAASQGHVEVARMLVDAGADLEARSAVRPRLIYADAINGGAFDQGVMEQLGGYSPLLFAARNGRVEVADLLLDAGADIEGAAGNGASPLVVATHSGQFTFARRLLERDADPNAIGAGYNALHAAILRGDPDMVNALLAHGAGPNVRLQRPTPVQRASEDWALKTPLVGATPYWLAAYFREPEIMRALVQGGADPALTNQELYRRLRDRESRLNPPEPEVVGGFASAVQAAIRGASDRERYYLIANPDPAAEERLALETVMLAAEDGVKLDHADFTGATALHDAALRSLATIVRELAERDSDVNAVNGQGSTPLDLAIAAENRRPDVNLESPERQGPSASEVLRELGGVRSARLANARVQ